jgi:hypothetical protein
MNSGGGRAGIDGLMGFGVGRGYRKDDALAMLRERSIYFMGRREVFSI